MRLTKRPSARSLDPYRPVPGRTLLPTPSVFGEMFFIELGGRVLTGLTCENDPPWPASRIATIRHRMTKGQRW